MVLSRKVKNSPLVQGGLEIPISIRAEWKNEINPERLKAKVSSLAYSQEGESCGMHQDWKRYKTSCMNKCQECY